MRIEWRRPWYTSMVWWKRGYAEDGYPITDYLWLWGACAAFGVLFAIIVGLR